MRTLLPLLLAALLLPLPAPAQSPTTQNSELRTQNSSPPPIPGSRILKTFDFEEKKLGNFESIPMFWSKVAGHGFPAYSNGAFDPTLSRSPENSFKLQIDGGSVAFQYAPNKLPINPSADYYIVGFVKTTPLAHARAQISAWFADQDGKILPDTAIHSQPFASSAPPATTATTVTTATTTPWHVLHLYIPGPGPGSPARSLILQVGLLQPQQLDPPTAAALGRFTLYQQDLRGAAWFDDIIIFQLPRVSVTVPAAANIFAPSQKVELDLSVSDIAAHPSKGLSATLQITDPDGILFAGEKFTVLPTASAPWTHRFVHAALPPGLYTATLDVVDPAAAPSAAADDSSGPLVARRQTRFLCLAAPLNTAETPAPEFGITLPSGALGGGAGGGPGADSLWPDVPAILRHTRVGLVQAPAWGGGGQQRKDISEETLLRGDSPFDALLASLQRMDIRAIASFSDLPRGLSIRIGEARAKAATQPGPPSLISPPPPDSVLALYDADPALWRPYLSFLLARYANRVDAWEFGSLAAPFSGSLCADEDGAAGGHGYVGADPRYPQLYARTTAELAGLLNHPRLLVPWNALFEFDARHYPGARIDLLLPACIKPSQIPAYIQNFSEFVSRPAAASDNAPSLLAHIQPLDEDHYTRAERLADFAQRIVYARAADPPPTGAVMIDLPLSAALPGRFSSQLEPDELLLVYRTLVAAMGHRQFVREVHLAPGIKAFLFDRAAPLAAAGAGAGAAAGETVDQAGEAGAAGTSGTLIAWNESASEARVHLDLPLGTSPRAIDLLGNSRELAVASNDHAGSTTGIDITGTPLILDHVDSKALQLRAGFGIAATTLPAGAAGVRTQVLLSNPYNDTLTGSLKVIVPRGWTIEPSSIPISLAPGAALRQMVTVRYPYSEITGPKNIEGRFTTDNGQKFEFSSTLTVTSDVVELDSSAQLMPDGDLVIQQVITNISQSTLNAQAYALVPGYPRQQRYLLGLAPGQTTIKRFVFPASSFVNATGPMTAHDIAAALTGKTAAVGMRDNDGRTLITKALPLE